MEALITEFVVRNATDYGEMEVPLECRIERVRKQLC
ncbi:MAG: YheU family protein [Deltaproteobacteria bacterium]|nr:YheU family protein [Deltaproteobacteria bacterium]